MFGTSMLYEVFEKLIFGVSCLMFLSRFGRYGVFVQVFLVFFLPGRVGLMILFLDCGKGKYIWFMLFGLVLESLWCMSFERLICGVYGYLFSLGNCCVLFAGYFWFMYPPCRIGLLMLTLGYLTHFSLLQRSCLVVGCYVQYWGCDLFGGLFPVYVSFSQDRFVEFDTWLCGALQPVGKDLV